MAFVIAVLVLMISAMAAIEMREIAKMKGFDESKYFWWCFLFFPFGAAMVIALPDRSNVPYITNTPENAGFPSDELPDL